jgi:glycosyltransferase involved in cell wall biosynthesis
MTRVAVLAARALPNDCGIWTASRAIIEALARHGKMKYTFEVNSSQSDLKGTWDNTDRICFIDPLLETIPRWARWMDGGHPRFPRADRLRDFVYNHAPSVKISRRYYSRAARALNADVVFVPFQNVPFLHSDPRIHYVLYAYDFRGEHLPEFETRESLKTARALYAGYRRAGAVLVLGETVREDAIRFAGVEADRVFVAPFGEWPMPEVGGEFRTLVRRKFNLPERFIFYPAPSRPHKNHLRLIRALADLKKQGFRIPLVTTGRQRPHSAVLEQRIRELGMESDVILTGYVDLETLSALYDLCTVVALPTLFEGATGIPLLEAMAKGKPIAAAAVCEIPSALGEAGILFDPLSESNIADALRRLWESESLCKELSARAKRAAAARSWTTFAHRCEEAFQYAAAHPMGMK